MVKWQVSRRSYLKTYIDEDLKEKMVFLGGPRQVGKTTFAQSFLKNYQPGHESYLNWDDPNDRKRFLHREWPEAEKIIIFDEIHKYKRWRNTIKGYWDTLKQRQSFLVTGSARLDHYRRGGDSLLGRFHYYRLHPLGLGEVGFTAERLDHLLQFGGFPEPFLKGSDRHLRRWHRERNSRIVEEDIHDLEDVKDLSLMELLIDALPERVGSPLSRKNLAQDLEVDFKTVDRWIRILENVYYCYRISPFGAPKIRAAKKEQKLYLWDWSEHTEIGKKWENLVASHLLKYCHFLEATEGFKMELRFLRDHDGREVDFVVMKDKRPLFAVECKTGEREFSKHLSYFAERTNIPVFYQVHKGLREKSELNKIIMMPFVKFAAKVLATKN